MEPIKDAFHRLLRFGHAAKERALPVWKSAVLQSEPALHWLKLQFGRRLLWLTLRPRVVFWAGGIGIALAFLVFSGATAAGAALLGWAALRQAATANDRHHSGNRVQGAYDLFDQSRRVFLYLPLDQPLSDPSTDRHSERLRAVGQCLENAAILLDDLGIRIA
jgi:hypothetical protein